MMKMATTHAKMGRWMKNWGIASFPDQVAGVDETAGAGVAAAGAFQGCATTGWFG
jgi:hypothetical protein